MKHPLHHFIFSLLVMLLSVALAQSQTTTQITTPGTSSYTVPCGATSITIQVWGGGGAGGGCTDNNFNGGAGGGSGAYTTRTFTGLSGGEVISYTLGAGGTAVIGGSGGNGQASIVNFQGHTLTAGGGNGGGVNGGSVGTGGNASGGTTNTSGYSGAVGTLNYGGNGASAPNGGSGGTGVNNNPGNNGGAPGGGGGGGESYLSTDVSGGTGGNGRIVLTYTADYCQMDVTNNVVIPITNVSFNTINNSVMGTQEQESFCNISTSVQTGSSYSLSVQAHTGGDFTFFISAYFDWDQNGVFGNNSNEIYQIGSLTSSNGYDGNIVTNTIAIPANIPSGNTKMRIVSAFSAYASSSCTINYGQAEDYTVNVVNLPCVTPTASATNLQVAASGTTINGSFTAANPAADNYVVFYSTSATPPTLVDGTEYVVNNTYENYTVAANGTETNFSVNNLQIGSTYYFYVYSSNVYCTGGPVYYTVDFASNSAETPLSYCDALTSASQVSGRYIHTVQFIGTLNDVSNTSTYTDGHENYTGLANKSIQAQGEGVNLYTEANSRGRWKAWVDWNKDGDFDDAGENVYDPGAYAGLGITFGFVIPENTDPGDYVIRIRVFNSFTTINGASYENFGIDFNSCETFDSYSMYYEGATRTFTEYGEAEDYRFTVIPSCNAVITSETEGETCGTGTADLMVSGSEGVTSFHWYDAETGGNLLATTTDGLWTTPVISSTTSYYVTADNGSCESYERTRITAFVSPIPTLSFSPENPVVCGEEAVVSLAADGDTEQLYLINEDFEAGTLGVFSNVNNDANDATYDAATKWQNYTSTIVPTGLVWFPAISSGFGDDHFVMATSDIDNSPAPNNINNMLVLTNSVNTTDFLNLTLELELYYSRYLPDGGVYPDYPEYVSIEASNDGGSTWNVLQTYNTDIGIGTRFVDISLDLSAYINVSAFKIRFNHYSYSGAGWLPDGMAIDDVKLYGDKPLNTAFEWQSDTPVNAFEDEACTIPYVEGTEITTVYVKPTLAQLESGTYTFTASAVLTNGCYASTDVTVTNNSKVWQGYSNDWSDPNNWLPIGVPTEENCVIVKDVFNAFIPENTHGDAKTFRVKDGGEFVIKRNGSLTVQEWVDVETGGYFNIEDDASLIQVEDVANTGVITADRETQISLYDYVYWSSPVSNFSVQSISPNSPSWAFYQWLPTVNNSFGNWSSTSETMIAGKGYIVRAPNGYPSATDQLFTAQFEGTPNNGTITKTIQRGNYTGENYTNTNGITVTNLDDNYNLLGNPYPSAIDAAAFLTANPNLEGAVHIWTHGNDPAATTIDPFYNNFTYNYTGADYIIFNASGASTGAGTFDGYIGSGQGFFVVMSDGAAATETVTFDNSMRFRDYENNQFYRVAQNDSLATPTPEEGRFWLDLINPQQQSKRFLIGYIDGATDEKDRLYDAFTTEGGGFQMYSLIDTQRMIIQGKALPFNDQDIVPLGIKANSPGIYTLAIAQTTGFFTGEAQAIYIEDLMTNTIHNLKMSPYTFTISVPGRFEDRFRIIYTDNETLHNETVDVTAFQVQATSIGNQQLYLKSTGFVMESLTVYDMQGKKVYEFTNIQDVKFTAQIQKTNSPLLLNISDINGNTVTKKIIH